MQETPKIWGIALTVLMLVASNLFMTFAWYWHLRTQKTGGDSWPLFLIILVSWLIAFIEYMIAVPANRIGHAEHIDLAQLKIMQEVIALSVFVPFSIFYMKEPVKLNFLWAALCMLGAVYFIFKD